MPEIYQECRCPECDDNGVLCDPECETCDGSGAVQIHCLSCGEPLRDFDVGMVCKECREEL